MTNRQSLAVIAFIVVHWGTAVAVIGLFILGLWMVGLGYYDAWYQQAPYIHRSIGILLAVLTLVRVVWRKPSTLLAPLSSHQPWERISAKVAHGLLYGLLLVICFSGYFISTAKGQAVEVFSWFSVPAVVSSINNLEDISGVVHKTCAFSLIGLVILHAAAAFKHHFLDRDSTLVRMFGK